MPIVSVTVSTEEAARLRRTPGSSPWNGIFAMVYLFGVIAFLAISIAEDVWGYRSTPASFLIAFAWTAPFAIAAHLVHFLTGRAARARASRTIDGVVDAVDTAVARAGLPRLDGGALRRMLVAQDNGRQPYTGEGKFPYQPLLVWDLPTEDPSVVLTATRGGSPETVTLERLDSPTADRRRDAAQTTTVLATSAWTAEAPITASRVGGSPAAPDDFVWPTCAEHGTPMRFLAQVEHEQALLLMFVCTTEPGMCDSWDPDAGCNAVLPAAGRALRLQELPSADATVRAEPLLLGVRTYDTATFEDAAALAAAEGVHVLGQYGGGPAWVQEDETPVDAPIFVASFDEDPPGFDSGAVRTFVFTDGAGRAKMLSQS